MGTMKIMTEKEVARSLKDVLDEAERGETVVITRDGKRVATMEPVPEGNWGAVIDAFRDWAPSGDDELEADIASVRVIMNAGADRDPWAE